MPKEKKCCESHCRNKAAKGSRYCHKCRSRRWREKNPMMASYVTLRYNAKRRGKVFTITFEYFKEFCYETDYMAGKGRTKGCFTVDRIKEELGYIPGNLQKLEVGENKRKHLHYDWQTGYATVTTEVTSKDEWFDE